MLTLSHEPTKTPAIEPTKPLPLSHEPTKRRSKSREPTKTAHPVTVELVVVAELALSLVLPVLAVRVTVAPAKIKINEMVAPQISIISVN